MPNGLPVAWATYLSALEEEVIAATQGDLSTDALVDRWIPASAQVDARITDSLKKLTQSQKGSALPVLLCQSPARYSLRRWLEAIFPRITVLSPNEIGPETRACSVGMLKG